MNFMKKASSFIKGRLGNAKAQNETTGEEANETAQKVKKIIKFAALGGGISHFLLVAVIAAVLIIFITVPILAVHQGLQGVSDILEKTMNFLSFRGFNSSQEAFFKTLRDEYEDYSRYFSRVDELDVALVAATIHHSKLVDSDYFADPDNFEDFNGDVDENEFSLENVVESKDTKKFYQWANDRIGSSYTLYLDKRGLLGALVSAKFTKRCVDAENAPNPFTVMADLLHQLFRMMGDTTADAWTMIINHVFSAFTGGNPGPIDSLQETFQGAINVGYDVKNIFDFSELNEVTCEEEEIAIPGLYKFNDYEKYDRYLTAYFIPKYLLPKETPEEQKESDIEKIRDEIYQSRDMFLYLMEYNKNDVLYTSCQSITVTGDNAGTYPLEEYVAGVVQHELGGGGPEALRAQAIVARTFAISSTNNCTTSISNSESQQTFSPNPGEAYLQAAYDTAGMVLTYNGQTFAPFYASYPKDGYSWAGVPDCAVSCSGNECTTTLYRSPNKEPNEFTMPRLKANGGYWNGADLLDQRGHCMGMSQVGAMYLEESEGYNYEEILNRFYSQGFQISSLLNTFSKSGLIAGRYEGFYQRVGAPTPSDRYFNSPYVNSSNLGQCVWYVKGRAQEILETVNIDASIRTKAVMAVRNTSGNGRDWFNNPSLAMFGYSTDYSKPKIGAIAVWEYTSKVKGPNYGHVAIVEDVDEVSKKVTISEGWRTRHNGSWDYSTGWKDVAFNTRTESFAWMQNYGGDRYRFLGYVYLLD